MALRQRAPISPGPVNNGATAAASVDHAAGDASASACGSHSAKRLIKRPFPPAGAKPQVVVPSEPRRTTASRLGVPPKMIWSRLKEPSTWAGFASALAALGWSTPAIATFTTIGAAVAAIVAMIVPENQGK